jgi:ERCC4-type nuclease
MIRLDERVGSKDLAPLLRKYGLRIDVCHLDYGDLDWMGLGPKGPCPIVAERKRIDDLLQSFQSNRLAGHQIIGMSDCYDYGYLIVEGIYKPGADGQIMVLCGSKWVERGMHYRALDAHLSTLELQCG